MIADGITMFEPIGKCIYCDDVDELSDEHIIPYALGWHAKIPMASCKRHREITHAFEGRCAGKIYKAVRVHNRMQSRQQLPTELPIIGIADNRNIFTTVPIEEHLGIFPIFHFTLPGILRGVPKSESSWAGSKFTALPIGARKSELWDSRGFNAVRQTIEFDCISLGRMLAKIAHAAAVGQFGYRQFDSWLIPLIEHGDETSLSYLVGCDVQVAPPSTELHELTGRVQSHEGKLLIIYDIRLFANFLESPTFRVVVGQIAFENFDRVGLTSTI